MTRAILQTETPSPLYGMLCFDLKWIRLSEGRFTYVNGDGESVTNEVYTEAGNFALVDGIIYAWVRRNDDVFKIDIRFDRLPG